MRSCVRDYSPPSLSVHRGGFRGGGVGGGVVGFEKTPLFADSSNLLVCCYSQQCSTLRAGKQVQFGYCIIYSVQFYLTQM